MEVALVSVEYHYAKGRTLARLKVVPYEYHWGVAEGEMVDAWYGGWRKILVLGRLLSSSLVLRLSLTVSSLPSSFLRSCSLPSAASLEV